MRHLNRDRRAVDQHDLVAPVELESLARRKAQRHVGLRCRRTGRGAPLPGIVPDRVVAALVTEPAQLLENPDQRQPLATRLALVRKQQVIKLFTPRINPRQRLATAFVPELGRLRPDHLAHNLPRYPELAADRLDRLLLGKVGPPDLRNRLHYQHPKTGSHVHHKSHCGPAVPRVPFGCRSPRKRGPYSTPNHTRPPQRPPPSRPRAPDPRTTDLRRPASDAAAAWPRGTSRGSGAHRRRRREGCAAARDSRR